MLEDLNTFVDNIFPTDEEVIAGIDEAGRGPVVGPMVYSICVLRSNEKTNFKDSKTLTPKQREALFKSIHSYALVCVSPVYISSCMLSKTLNEIAREAVCKLIMALGRKCPNVRTVYVDGLGNNETYKAFLARRFPFEFVVENKADFKYPVVGGASIAAKVTRDAHVSQLACGSGYPGDPKTKAWLRKNINPVYGFPEFVRHSWATARALLPQNKSRQLKGDLAGFYLGPA